MIDTFFTALVFVFGATIGSFLNVVILRSIAGEGIGQRSYCPHCHQTLRWWELVPIVSFILLQGRCNRCHKRISVQYPLVELAMGLSMLVLATPLPETSQAIVTTALASTIVALLLVLFVVDLHTLLLPDTFVAGLLLVTIALLINQSATQTIEQAVLDPLWGIVIGAGFLLFLWLITRGAGIGFGDVKLMVPLGALLGLTGTITLLFLAFIVGGLVGIVLLSSGRASLKTAIPFGPFLAGAAIVLLLVPSFPTYLMSLLFPY